MIAIIVVIMLFLSFFVVVSHNVMSVNHNLTISTTNDDINNEVRLIKSKLVSLSIPIVDSQEYALPYGVSYSNEHRLPENAGLPLKNIKGYYYHYCPYGVVDGTIKTESVIQNDGSTYSVANTLIDGVKYVTHSEPAFSDVSIPKVAAFIISKFESATVSCSDIEYEPNTNTFYLMNAKVVAITDDELQLYNRSDLSSTTLELGIDNESVSSIFQTLENDQSNRNYNLKLKESVILTEPVYMDRETTTNVSIDLNGFVFEGNALSFNNVNINIYSPLLNESQNGVDLTINNANVDLNNVSFGKLSLTNATAYIENAFTSIDSQVQINSINSSINIQDQLQYKSGVSFTSLFNLVGSKLLVNGDIDDLSSSGAGSQLVIIDSGSSMHLNDSRIHLSNSMGVGANVFHVKGRLTTSNTGNSLSIDDSSQLNDIFNVEGGYLYLDSFTSNASDHQGYTVNNESKDGVVVIKEPSTLSNGGNGCIRQFKDTVIDSEIVSEPISVDC